MTPGEANDFQMTAWGEKTLKSHKEYEKVETQLAKKTFEMEEERTQLRRHVSGIKNAGS
jgi:hypothetical protein